MDTDAVMAPHSEMYKDMQKKVQQTKESLYVAGTPRQLSANTTKVI